MPFILLVIGIAFAVAALRNTHKQLAAQLVTDFTGTGSFIYWIAAIMIIGLLGYIPEFKTPSRLLLGLVLLGLFVSNQGFFAQLQTALAAGPAQTASEQTPAEPAPPEALTVKIIGGSGGDPKSGGGILDDIGGIAKAATTVIGFL